MGISNKQKYNIQEDMDNETSIINLIEDDNKIENTTKQDETIINLQKSEAKSSQNSKKYQVVATENGYNLMTIGANSTIFQIFKTSSKDVFLAQRNNVNGILIKKANTWFFEYYNQNRLQSEQIEVEL